MTPRPKLPPLPKGRRFLTKAEVRWRYRKMVRDGILGTNGKISIWLGRGWHPRCFGHHVTHIYCVPKSFRNAKTR